MSAVPLTNSESELYSLYKQGDEEKDEGEKDYSERGNAVFREIMNGFSAVRILLPCSFIQSV